MPLPFQFSASFLAPSPPADGASAPAADSAAPDAVRCTPSFNLNLMSPLPLPKRAPSPPKRRMVQCGLTTGGTCTCGAPVELLVIAHGLQGAVADFSYLLDELDASGPAADGALLVHAPGVNTDRTHDGVVAGGTRVAADIRMMVRRHPSLRRISLVGFSLGGLYMRYAAALLFEDGLVAGLTPGRFVSVAAPNLGVRNFGVYRFLPQPVRARANLFIGVTGLELFLEDENPLLLRMSRDDAPGEGGLQFVSALRSFSQRVLYANTRNDFMVNYGTAALDEDVQVVSANDVQAIVASPKGQAVKDVDLEHDEKGCKVCFTFKYEAGDGIVDSAEENRAETGNTVSIPDHEKVMAKRLRDIGWTVVAVDFPIAIPIAVRVLRSSALVTFDWFIHGY